MTVTVPYDFSEAIVTSIFVIRVWSYSIAKLYKLYQNP